MATKTSFSDLYADVLLCIFDYFTVNEIYEIFSEVIPYLTSLLINSKIILHLRKSISSPINPAYIMSIDLICLPRITSPTISDFINLRSLILRDIEDPQILVNQSLSRSLENLYINLSLRNKPEYVISFLSFLTELPKLTRYTLIYPSSYFVFQEDMFTLPKSSLTIKYVKLDVKCSINSLEKVLRHLPCLRYFQATAEFNPENSTISLRKSLFPNIQKLNLIWNYIPFQIILMFCKMMPNLEQCTLTTDDYRYDQKVFNPNIWRQFIKNDHVLLKKLIVNMTPRPYEHEHGTPRPSNSAMQHRYFHSINFKFQADYRRDIVLKGHYIKSN